MCIIIIISIIIIIIIITGQQDHTKLHNYINIFSWLFGLPSFTGRSFTVNVGIAMTETWSCLWDDHDNISIAPVAENGNDQPQSVQHMLNQQPVLRSTSN